jgi:hypothetical protein
MNLLDTLSRAADEEALRLNPLPTHALAEKPEHLRRHYALILAALLTAQPEVSEAQTRLLRLLLDSLKLGDIRAALFEEARALTPEVLLEAARLVRDAAAAEELLVDALVLLRLPAPLNDDTSRLIAELAAFLGLDEETVANRVQNAQEILGIGGEGENQDGEQTASPLAELWPSAIPRPLTTAALQAGITDGIWYLDDDLTVTFPWKAENTILLFRDGAQLNINSAQQGEVNLTNCRLIDPFVTVQGKVSLTVNRCTWQGHYDPLEEITALSTANITATISDSTFTLNGARAILVQDGSLTVTGCHFDDCGCSTLDGGAIWLSEYAGRNITHNRFEACTARKGGAIFAWGWLSGIHHCEFVLCTSPGLQEKDASDLALWAEKNQDGPVITHCVFRYCSLYVGHSGYSPSGRTIAQNCQFDHGNLFRYGNNYHTFARDCLLTEGQVIERQL